MRRAGTVLLVAAWGLLLWGAAHLVVAQQQYEVEELGRGLDALYQGVRWFTLSAVLGAAGVVILQKR